MESRRFGKSAGDSWVRNSQEEKLAEMGSDVAVLISTYDGAQTLWRPLEKTFERYWPDRPFKTYLSTNHVDAQLKTFSSLCIGDELSWSDNISKSLDKISEKYILLTFDDLFLQGPVDTRSVLDLAKIMIEKRWEYLRFNPFPPPDQIINEEVGKISRGRLYRTAGVWALFDKAVLKSLLRKEENAWQFELLGCARSDIYENFYSVKKSKFPYLNGVIKGKWVPSVLKKLEEEGFYVGESTLPIMTKSEVVFYSLLKLRSLLFGSLIPKKFQRYIRQKTLKR